MDSSVSGKDEIWFLRVCHHVPHELYSNMHFTCTKGTKFLYHPSDYQLVKKANVRFGTVKKPRVCSDTTVGNAERHKTLTKTAVTHNGVTNIPHSTLR